MARRWNGSGTPKPGQEVVLRAEVEMVHIRQGSYTVDLVFRAYSPDHAKAVSFSLPNNLLRHWLVEAPAQEKP